MDEMKSGQGNVSRRKAGARPPRPMHPTLLDRLLAMLGMCLLVLAPGAVQAQSALEATQIVIGAPAQSDAGAPITLQALLTDGQGHPISNEVIYFTTQDSFLHGNGDVVLAQAVTNKDGQAVAQFADDFSGTITLAAEFRGDTQYAASEATTPVATAGQQQVYADHVGVDIPGLNVPPVSSPMASVGSPAGGVMGLVAGLWPAMNGWPLAAILLLVWSMYLLAVRYVFRVAALGNEADDLPEFDSRRPS